MSRVPMLPVSKGCTIDHWPIVHASMPASEQLEFYGPDSKERYENNSSELVNWEYQGKTITYNFNDAGLRMNKNIQDVDSRYFVAFGCSQTLGVGVALEDTWPYLLSQEIGVDYINSAVVGSSVKLNAINFFNMLGKIKHLPYAVIFAWPSSSRHCFYTNDEFAFYLPNHVPNIEHYTSAYHSLLSTDYNVNESMIYRNMIRATCNQLGIKYIDFSFDSMDEFTNVLDNAIIDNTQSYARDRSHVGIGYHRMAVDYVKKDL